MIVVDQRYTSCLKLKANFRKLGKLTSRTWKSYVDTMQSCKNFSVRGLQADNLSLCANSSRSIPKVPWLTISTPRLRRKRTHDLTSRGDSQPAAVGCSKIIWNMVIAEASNRLSPVPGLSAYAVHLRAFVFYPQVLNSANIHTKTNTPVTEACDPIK